MQQRTLISYRHFTFFAFCSFLTKMAKRPVKYSVVDAFTDSAFKGNPAAVCFLEEDRDEQWLQSVAAEFNVSETCYLSPLTESEVHDSPNESSIPRYRLRWFTPVAEVKLCGHATLAAAHTLFMSGTIESDVIEFDTLSGILTAKKVLETKPSDGSNSEDVAANKGFFVELNCPSDLHTELNSVQVSSISKALGGATVMDIKRTAILDYLIVVVPSAKDVLDLQPDFDAIRKFPGTGTIVTGIAPPESRFDFYSRFFAPNAGINEDPVTGSAHCSLASYWREELEKSDFVACQASPRGGVLNILLDEQNHRVLLRGKAITIMEGAILV